MPSDSSHAHGFGTTRWSLVFSAASEDADVARAAFGELCEAYWLPIYAYARRRSPDVHAAQDLTQSFFARMLAKDWLEKADPARGRFRAFLLTACKRFLMNEHDRATAKKRGGGRAPLSLDFDSGESLLAGAVVDTLTPEDAFHRQWALTLLGRVLAQLEADWRGKGKHDQFTQLAPFLTGTPSRDLIERAASNLNLTENALLVAAHRFRKKYHALLRAEIAQTLDDPTEVDAEIAWLFQVLGKS